MGIRPAITAIAVLFPTAVAVFCIERFGDKYAAILSPAYIGTCYQSAAYLHSYILANMTWIGLTGAATATAALFFRNINWFAYLCLCGLIAVIIGMVAIRTFAAGSC